MQIAGKQNHTAQRKEQNKTDCKQNTAGNSRKVKQKNRKRI